MSETTTANEEGETYRVDFRHYTRQGQPEFEFLRGELVAVIY